MKLRPWLRVVIILLGCVNIAVWATAWYSTEDVLTPQVTGETLAGVGAFLATMALGMLAIVSAVCLFRFLSDQSDWLGVFIVSPPGLAAALVGLAAIGMGLVLHWVAKGLPGPFARFKEFLTLLAFDSLVGSWYGFVFGAFFSLAGLGVGIKVFLVSGSAIFLFRALLSAIDIMELHNAGAGVSPDSNPRQAWREALLYFPLVLPLTLLWRLTRRNKLTPHVLVS